MSDIKTIGNEEQQVLEAPDSFRGSDLGQSPADPGLDGITEQQSDADNGSENLHGDQYATTG